MVRRVITEEEIKENFRLGKIDEEYNRKWDKREQQIKAKASKKNKSYKPQQEG